MQAADSYATIYAYLRRTYYDSGTGTWRASDLKALADTVFASATREVAITTQNFEGGGASGVLKFDKAILLQAIEALLQAECADTLPPEAPPSAQTNFSNAPSCL